MRSIRKRDTKPELVVRRALHAAGLRFRLHRRDLPGCPDIVLPGRRLVVLVHGCFWHQHPGCPLARRPRGNQDYWLPKLERVQRRDAAAIQALESLGWNVRIVWECETRDQDAVTALVAEVHGMAPVGRGRARAGLGASAPP
jgi:DNA mismatch endonuclease, patch repair protein